MLSVRPRCSITPRINSRTSRLVSSPISPSWRAASNTPPGERRGKTAGSVLLRLGGIALLAPHGDDLGLDVDPRHPVGNGGIVVDGARVGLAHQLGKGKRAHRRDIRPVAALDLELALHVAQREGVVWPVVALPSSGWSGGAEPCRRVPCWHSARKLSGQLTGLVKVVQRWACFAAWLSFGSSRPGRARRLGGPGTGCGYTGYARFPGTARFQPAGGGKSSAGGQRRPGRAHRRR